MSIVRCIYCERELNTRAPGSFERVTGWLQGAGAKGFRTDTHTGDWCHESCLTRQKQGIAPAQESMFGDVAA